MTAPLQAESEWKRRGSAGDKSPPLAVFKSIADQKNAEGEIWTAMKTLVGSWEFARLPYGLNEQPCKGVVLARARDTGWRPVYASAPRLMIWGVAQRMIAFGQLAEHGNSRDGL